MGGVVSAVTGGIKRAVGDVVTGGLAETNLGGGIFKRIGGTVGSALTGDVSGAIRGFTGTNNNGNSAAYAPGSQSPLDVLTNTGGAPLLTSIALGVKPDDALASYFGVKPTDFQNWLSTRSSSEQSAISSLSTQLNEISTDVNLKNTAVNKLVEDFPNYMKQAVPQYSHIMDDATKQMMNQALDRVSAKQAAGGMFSSGATVEAAARIGADFAGRNVEYGTNLALQDWNQQYSNAEGLRNFQQKMLGQGAAQGFNAVQNALAGNRQVGITNAGFQYGQNQSNQQAQNAMYGSLCQLGGTLIGGSMFGPIGALAGGQVGGFLAPRFNSISNNAFAGQVNV